MISAINSIASSAHIHLTKANFKVGAYTGHSVLYDVSIDTQNIDLQYLISQTEYFLTRITKNQDELSAV